MREADRLQSTIDIATPCADVIERVRARSPRVHCITNAVAQNFTANVLLAAGARPSMTISPEEIGSFVASADALLVNLGTFDAARREAADRAIEVAAEEGLPWVLDPVLIDRSQPRAAYAADLVTRGPRAVRLNRAEFTALASAAPEGETLWRYAGDARTVIGLTGETDVVSDGARVATIRNGHPLMARVTAMGCVASALVAACLAIEGDAWLATTAALLAIGVAGEGAAAHARGPGSFAMEILDALDRLDRDGLLARAKVQ
ncbi:MAG: hydroxyethylthiazole kinase [Bradyrhizobiaceae bacterium]|nr:hydroxyethylthiazole kinase [Hyphomicrobiales bacterium]MBV9428704.1 hydroxyethylthiazole kinase [Bradyrhizobiaceae bacterium]